MKKYRLSISIVLFALIIFAAAMVGMRPSTERSRTRAKEAAQQAALQEQAPVPAEVFRDVLLLSGYREPEAFFSTKTQRNLWLFDAKSTPPLQDQMNNRTYSIYQEVNYPVIKGLSGASHINGLLRSLANKERDEFFQHMYDTENIDPSTKRDQLKADLTKIDSEHHGTYSSIVVFDPLFVSDRFVSVKLTVAQYAGGAGGYVTPVLFNYDIKKGREISLADIISGPAGFKAISDHAARHLKAIGYGSEDSAEEIGADFKNFAVTRDYIEIYLHATSTAGGLLRACVPWAEIKDHLKIDVPVAAQKFVSPDGKYEIAVLAKNSDAMPPAARLRFEDFEPDLYDRYVYFISGGKKELLARSNRPVEAGWSPAANDLYVLTGGTRARILRFYTVTDGKPVMAQETDRSYSMPFLPEAPGYLTRAKVKWIGRTALVSAYFAGEREEVELFLTAQAEYTAAGGLKWTRFDPMAVIYDDRVSITDLDTRVQNTRFRLFTDLPAKFGAYMLVHRNSNSYGIFALTASAPMTDPQYNAVVRLAGGNAGIEKALSRLRLISGMLAGKQQ